MSNKILNRLVNLKRMLEKSTLETDNIHRTLTTIKQPNAQLQKQNSDKINSNKSKLELIQSQKRNFNLRNDALGVSQEEVS